eukprot:338477-Pelagomonas_calceolata.AAC.2
MLIAEERVGGRAARIAPGHLKARQVRHSNASKINITMQDKKQKPGKLDIDCQPDKQQNRQGCYILQAVRGSRKLISKTSSDLGA